MMYELILDPEGVMTELSNPTRYLYIAMGTTTGCLLGLLVPPLVRKWKDWRLQKWVDSGPDCNICYAHMLPGTDRICDNCQAHIREEEGSRTHY